MKKKSSSAQLDGTNHTSRSKRSTTKQTKKSENANKIIIQLQKKIKMIYVGIDVQDVSAGCSNG